MEKPISMTSIVIMGSAFALVLLVLLGKAWSLQAKDGAEYAAISENNILRETVIFAERGAVFDRNGVKLAWNAINEKDPDFARRVYTKDPGFGHVLGYIRYPAKDSKGFYYRTDYEGVAGVEKHWDSLLQGSHGLKILQKNALGEVESESVIRPAKDGENLSLSIDASVQKKLYESIAGLAERVGFSGGGGMIMDIETGETIALTSYPEYKSSVMTDGGDSDIIADYLKSSRKPFLNRVTGGLYTPGSIVKPLVAIAALEEGIIDPEKQILSTGSISIQNPYDKTRKTTFSDWKAHGLVDMRKAIAVSSNVYFYEVGGGFEDQKGLGIGKLAAYFQRFGLGSKSETGFFSGPGGTVPTPEWKEKVFPGDPWRIGDTYFTSIGQYGFQVTPLQMLRAVAAIANGGLYIEPSILKSSTSTPAAGKDVRIDPGHLEIAREGMRLAAQSGTASGLNVPYVDVAAKTGTAELGVSKAFVNSWVTGFFPYRSPKYAFIVMMEHGPRANVYGATFVMRELLDWMNATGSEYLK